MRTWEIATRERRCGCCGKPVVPGHPILVMRIPEVRERKVRCADCAGECSPIPREALSAAAIPFRSHHR